MKKNNMVNITAHCIIQNEDKWIWFALQSILPYVDKILVFDTGSSDKTVDIIKSINSPKIIFEEKNKISKEEFVRLRQEQIERTKTSWFLIIDGDEIWPKTEIEKLINQASNADNNIIAIFNRTRNCIGDTYHYLPDEAGKYKIGQYKGNLNIRLIRLKKDLKISGSYPFEYYHDKNGPLQEQTENILFADCWYLHTTFLKRTTNARFKTSGSLGKSKMWERGIVMKKEDLPEVIIMPRPHFINDPLIKRGLIYEILALIMTPLLILKRKLI